MKRGKIFNKGTSLIEAIIGVAIIGLTVVGSMTTFNLYIKSWQNNLSNIQSSYILNEGVEGVFLQRDLGWSTYVEGKADGVTKYYFSWDSGNNLWTLNTTPYQIDGKYDRYVIFSPVNRDANDNIAVSGSNDPDTNMATVYVGWATNSGTTTKSAAIYLFNIFNE
ncbi:MAG: hypothetical protein A3H57_00065 [Candidatus Taylorbacteria bacterium RIFCSPLOWO2_02_FULL_43_11]|uniref:Prepilin-type N-terminal cleavage/methylation domain-containing protein n=1 Tax=Candidatus Taylorbacteria bacterium RIFCSPHIGHO2_02_FULL_43_32b TaxID=1802306 RepID=A0A1G2MLB6_9BACT|nr:MAG: hypothetical protein A2743_01895 [Candidatus Taylorbacteria bacterium RIFCSPHIGHO2_01_FULL_43_47]OHA23831.1 MAG: hypothetical protein A3C72_01360 [Candidatus Taylorbacteria bacterium RIFCSPHIGHO2_02_FULL_43_32b]OHA37460.1 MAG: hypothetical protein A3H57_00065 [Candidatus Taylorbacteria bacterium RIFCSPLOWO2_02_FULL_43_11]